MKLFEIENTLKMSNHARYWYHFNRENEAQSRPLNNLKKWKIREVRLEYCKTNLGLNLNR